MWSVAIKFPSLPWPQPAQAPGGYWGRRGRCGFGVVVARMHHAMGWGESPGDACLALFHGGMVCVLNPLILGAYSGNPWHSWQLTFSRGTSLSCLFFWGCVCAVFAFCVCGTMLQCLGCLSHSHALE